MLDEAVVRSPTLLALALSGASLHCGGCETSTGLTDEGVRVWGRHKLDEDVKARAAAAIDPYKLDANFATRKQVLTMPFDEVVSRYGFLRLETRATFDLNRNGHAITVQEHTIIEHGRHGSFRVLQKDKDGDVTRESVFNNGVLYLRNGPKGKMRVQGIIEDRHLALREEAWAPLKAFTSYFGPRLGMRQAGVKRVSKRPSIRYRLSLVDGPQWIEVPGMKGKKAPVALSGDIYVDEKTGVATKVKLRGELRIPVGADAGTNAEEGVLKVFLESNITPGSGDEIKPEAFVPTIAHRPVDLDPLRFLESDTRTSTVIGGRR